MCKNHILVRATVSRVIADRNYNKNCHQGALGDASVLKQEHLLKNHKGKIVLKFQLIQPTVFEQLLPEIKSLKRSQGALGKGTITEKETYAVGLLG